MIVQGDACERNEMNKLEACNSRINQPHFLSGLVHAPVKGKHASRPSHSQGGVFDYL